jgi:hypothetical protein
VRQRRGRTCRDRSPLPVEQDDAGRFRYISTTKSCPPMGIMRRTATQAPLGEPSREYPSPSPPNTSAGGWHEIANRIVVDGTLLVPLRKTAYPLSLISSKARFKICRPEPNRQMLQRPRGGLSRPRPSVPPRAVRESPPQPPLPRAPSRYHRAQIVVDSSTPSR